MNIVFVCQRGELEIKAVLLAWSLRRFLGQDVNLIAACPQFLDWGDLSGNTKAMLNALGVQLASFIPAFGERYPIGNKISALALLPEGQSGCFIDSDILCLSPWSLTDDLEEHTTLAKPADMGTWGSDSAWQALYSACEITLPERRVRLTVTGQLSSPYFNAGFVASSQPQRLAANWLMLAQQFDQQSPPLENKYPWLDQIALPLAMIKTGSWGVLDERFNFPAHLRLLADSDIALCHYHSPQVILREPRLCHLFNCARQELQCLDSLLATHPAWRSLISLSFPSVNYKVEERNFLITGIPRSGTSYVSSILDAQDNWLVLNEPGEIFAHLNTRKDASGIGQFHAESRASVLLGEPVKNKVKNGKVIQDTAQLDAAELYHPRVHSADFWLGSKNTLAYLASLPKVIDLGWPVIAMVRHPLDTIASWRNTFNHLRDAKPSELPIANPQFHGWSAQHREYLLELDLISDARLRRVLFWRLLASVLIEHRDAIQLYRYEDVITDPSSFLASVAQKLNYHKPNVLASGSLRNRVDQYDPVEREMLADLCSSELALFGYSV